MQCRNCGAPLSFMFADLGLTPISNSYVKADKLTQGEIFYPLRAWVCSECKLVQLEQYERVENIFNDEYMYFSSYSTSWLAHAKNYCEKMIARFNLGSNSRVIEVASNDGYLLQNFVSARIPVLGIEPSGNTANIAITKGIPTWIKFFNTTTAKELVISGLTADLILANNVLAHVPDINDFVAGFKLALKPEGVITFEFPHLLNLVQENQFDTIYHEHFSYLSLLALENIFSKHGLEVFDVEELPTHGGSLRVFVQHLHGPHPLGEGVSIVRAKEAAADLNNIDVYSNFSTKISKIKFDLIQLLMDCKKQGLSIAAYGAPAKGNTLLNHCGIGPDFIDFTVDLSPYKQGTWLPGTRIPVYAPEKIREAKPDIILILPWNLKEEIMASHSYIRKWGGRFLVPIPRVEYV